MAREHLGQIWQKAIGCNPTVADRNELVSYRGAVLVGGIRVLYLFFWLWRSGMSPLVASVYLFALVVMTVGVIYILLVIVGFVLKPKAKTDLG